MKHINCKSLTAALLALVMAVLCGCAAAEDEASLPAAQSAIVAELLNVPDFKFFEREDGIGSGACPVYTAPSEDSLRLADGKARCNMGSEMAVAGYVDGWLMVRYEIKDKKVRVGYVPERYSKGMKANIGILKLVSIPVQVVEDTEITDNPRDNSTPYGTLPAETEVTILGKYTYSGNWWYVETRLDGKLTRGFINRGTSAILADGAVYHGNEELGIPVAAPDGTKRTGTVTVDGTEEDARIVRKNANPQAGMAARVYGTDVYPCYGMKVGTNNKDWYRIWVDGVWGWISSSIAAYAEGW